MTLPSHTDGREDPRKRDDSVVGLSAECMIVDLYSQDGKVLAVIVDPDLRAKAEEQAKELAVYLMKPKHT